MGGRIGRGRILANVGLVLVILAVAGYGSLRIASRQWRVQKTFTVRADFGSIGGVGEGQRVRLQGMDAGVVESVMPPAEPGRPVRLVFRIDERLRSLIREDARARIASEGVVGAKVVEIVPGRADAAPLGVTGVISGERTVEMGDLIAKASGSLDRLTKMTAAAEQGFGDLNVMIAAVRDGEGSLGKFVRDDEAYKKLLALSTRGERTLTDVEENLAALKRTWPLSRYFNNRSFFDRDLVLYHPGAIRESRDLREDELFEPGRSVLTPRGRARLDDVAAWFKKTKRPATEVVIAAYTDDPREADLAQFLTQEQADSVRNYLVTRHAIDSTGWFGSRKVAAVGFGNELPRRLAVGNAIALSRRVEIILFTPQA